MVTKNTMKAKENHFFNIIIYFSSRNKSVGENNTHVSNTITISLANHVAFITHMIVIVYNNTPTCTHMYPYINLFTEVPNVLYVQSHSKSSGKLYNI